ncbi:MAG TPA: hypothetical protein PKW35_01340, partial [Nannocystaceae bacterium]|nr:hypothetical protein [Nannocystaceae bacterium]
MTMRNAILFHASCALVAAALLAVPYVVRPLARFRIVGGPREESTATTTPAAPAPSVGENALPASQNQGSVTNALPERAALPTAEELARLEGSIGIEDPTGHAL